MATKNLAVKEVMQTESARLRFFWERYRAKFRDEQERDISQAEFAETHLGFNGPNFGHILSGRQPIRLETLFDLAVLLDFDPREVRPSVQAHIDKVIKSIRGTESSLVIAYLSRLTPEQRAGVLDYARFLAQRPQP